MSDDERFDGQNDDPFLPISDISGDGVEGECAPAPTIEGYEILHKIGEAGQGQVWCAIQQSTDRTVAIKVPRFYGFGARKAFRRFEREVQLVARLKHPNIARVYDSGVNRGLYYFTMEYIDGRHLDRYVAEEKLSEKEILILIRRVCLAVQYAHQNAVIHRDLKPSNILITSDGQPHIVDFGLAKGLAEDDMTVTISQDEQPAGTPAYMSPEQAAGAPDGLDTRTDLYSIGVILYQLLTGALPHDMSGGRQTVLNRIASEPIIRPQIACPELNKEIGYILQKALAQEPERRYSSAQEFAQDIDHYLNGEPLVAGPESVLYVAKKYVGRHKGIVFGTLAGIIATIGGLISTSVLYWQAETARQTAQEAFEREERLSYVHVIQLADLKIKAGDYRGLRKMLEETSPSLRNWEWGYLAKNCQFPHWSVDYDGKINHSSISNDKKYLLICHNATRDVTLLNTETGELIWEINIPAEAGAAVQSVFSHSGDTAFIITKKKKLLVIETVNGQLLTEFTANASLTCLAASKDRLYVGSSKGLIQCYDMESWEILRTFQMEEKIRDMAVSPEADSLAVISGYGSVSLHNASSLEMLSDNGTVTGEGVRDVLVLPEKNKLVLAAGYGFYLEEIDKSLEGIHAIYNRLNKSTQNVRQVKDGVIQIGDHTQHVYTLDLSPDRSRMASSSLDGTVAVYDTKTWELLRVIYHDGAISRVFMPANDKIISVGFRGTVNMWSDITGKQEKPDVQIQLPKSVGCWELDYKPDASVLALNAWGHDQIILADAQTGDLSFVDIEGYAEEVEGDRSRPPTFFRPETSELVVKVKDTLRIHDVDLDGHPEIRRFQTAKEIYHAAMDPLGKSVAVCYKDGVIDLVSLDDGSCGTIPFDSDKMCVSHVAFSWDGSVISFLEEGGERRLISWNRWTGEKISSIKTGFKCYSESIAFHPDGQIVAIGDDLGNVYLWDIFSQQQVCKLSEHGPEAIHSLLFSADGERLISGGHDNALRFWDWKIQKNLFTIQQGYYPLDICFSPDGFDLACSDGRPVHTWIRKAIPWKEQEYLVKTNADEYPTHPYWYNGNRPAPVTASSSVSP